MGRIFKYLFYLMILAVIGLTVFAYVGDLSTPQTPVKKILKLDES